MPAMHGPESPWVLGAESGWRPCWVCGERTPWINLTVFAYQHRDCDRMPLGYDPQTGDPLDLLMIGGRRSIVPRFLPQVLTATEAQEVEYLMDDCPEDCV